MKSLLFFIFILRVETLLFGQADTTSLPIDTVRIESTSRTFTPSLTIASKIVFKGELERNTPANLSDALSRIPGVSQLSNGNAISKPIVRGLGGSRILILYNNIRFGNQQWQDEHGLGLSQIGVGSVEIIKGPLSVVYGSESIAGVLRITDEDFISDGKSHRDLHLRFYSNTLGTLSDAGWKSNKGKTSWTIRAGADSHGDYKDGNNTRVINSRYTGIYVKSGIKWNGNRWSGNFRYHFVRNRFGFILPDINPQTTDKRYDRSFTGPNHEVYFNILSNENILALSNSVLRINLGIQSNQRMEDEGGGSVSLNMFLVSALSHVIWEKSLNTKWKLIASQQSSRERNVNWGKRILIPDANTTELNSAAVLRKTGERAIWEFGGSYLNKWINSSATGINSDGQILLKAFSIHRNARNFMVGCTWRASRWMSLKINASSGVRIPNLAELASNGLREGTYRYEVGSIQLKNEKSNNADLGMTFLFRRLKFETGLFYQIIQDFIYLQPTTDQVLGFQVFRYEQVRANLRGGEIESSLDLLGTQRLFLKSAFSMVLANQENGKPLPMIPPYRLNNAITWKIPLRNKINFTAEGSAFHWMAQKRVATNETSTPAYTLFNVNIGMEKQFERQSIQATLGSNNVLNKHYYDHLSIIRNYGIYNMGRNIVFSLAITY